MREKISIEQSKLSEGLDFIDDCLKEWGIGKKQRTKTMLLVEESIMKLREYAEDVHDKIGITLNKGLNKVYVHLTLRGQELKLIQGDIVEEILDQESDEQESPEKKQEEVIRNVLLKANKDQIRYRNKNNTNIVEITVQKNPHAMVVQTMFALVAAVLVGMLMKMFVPDAVNTVLNDNIFTSISTMFLNALKMIVGPVVFFSIVCCISQFGDLKEVGRIGGKIMGFYMVTTVLAILSATGVFYLFRPGNPELASKLTADVSYLASSDVSISIKDTIVNIIPSNFVKPFLESNMLQLIFMAVLVGIALEKIGEYSKILKDIFEACNSLFLKITVILVHFIPIATFSSVLSVILKTGPSVLLSMLAMLGTFAAGIFVMMVIYCLLLVVIGHLNPVPFLKKYSPSMLQVFGMASSNAAIIVNMDACEHKLGISKKIYSLSIPLGATLNMDGTCIYLVIFALSLARVFGVDINGGMLVSMFVSVLVLSVGAPGVPGAGLVCLSVLLTQLQVPLAGIGLVMGLDSLLGMLRAMSNSLGDVVASLIVAKSEKVLDIEKYMACDKEKD